MADRGIGPAILNRHPLPYIPGYQGQPSRGFQDVYLGLPMEPNHPPILEACAGLITDMTSCTPDEKKLLMKATGGVR